jgi:TRAP-type C4-dicarboxylate transport system permease small subunit
MKSIERISLTVNRYTEVIVFVLGLTMALVVAAQVFSRYLLNHSLFWSEELARYLLVWLTFLGAAVAYRRGVHPGIDIVHAKLPPAAQRLTSLLILALSLGLFAVMIIYGIQFAWFVRLQISPALTIPKWTIFSIIPISGALLTIHALAFLGIAVKGRCRDG